MQQVWHSMEEVCGISRAENITQIHGSQRPRTIEDFLASPILPGSTVITRSAPKCPLAKAYPRVGELPFWVWRILRVFQQGCTLPANTMHIQRAISMTYEAHLYCPVGADGADWEDMTKPMQPCWDEQPETMFLSTEQEKADKRQKRDRGAHGDHRDREERESRRENRRRVVHVLATCFLRPDNIVGGGFSLSASKRIPPLVRQSVLSVVHPTEHPQQTRS